MIENEIIKLLLATELGITAYVFVHVLCQPGMLLHGWYRVLLHLPTWLAKPLGLCDRCLAGQMALWYYLLRYGHEYIRLPLHALTGHVLFICMAILAGLLISILMQNKN
jgi:hypothetical protein